jgi:hypothetical protein
MNLARLVKKWQHRLSLQQWQIRAEFVDRKKLDEDATADSSIDPYHMKANVRILALKFHDPEAPEYETVEHLVLHELLHCRLFPDGVKEGSDAHLAIEQGINLLCRLLLEEE